MQNRLRLIISCLILFFCTPLYSYPMTPAQMKASQTLSHRADVKKFIQMMVMEYDFDPSYLNKVFDNVKLQPQIITTMEKPAESWSWSKYRQYFINPERINNGVAFWKAHAKTLSEVEKEEGVPASIIVAIVGVETWYGKNQGTYRVIDALTTLAFNYPKRKVFFQNELKEYLLLARENQFDVNNFMGSYAGAIGQPQFMPSSYRLYAIDYRKTGVKDLRNDPDDVIASVGNYLRSNGWQPNQSVAARAEVTGNQYLKIKHNQLKPEYTLAKLAKYQIKPIGPISPSRYASFIVLKGTKGREYWLGFNNFYTITRYNPRINYAMAVYQLSEAIKKARGSTAGKKSHIAPSANESSLNPMQKQEP